MDSGSECRPLRTVEDQSRVGFDAQSVDTNTSKEQVQYIDELLMLTWYLYIHDYLRSQNIAELRVSQGMQINLFLFFLFIWNVVIQNLIIWCQSIRHDMVIRYNVSRPNVRRQNVRFITSAHQKVWWPLGPTPIRYPGQIV